MKTLLWLCLILIIVMAGVIWSWLDSRDSASCDLITVPVLVGSFWGVTRLAFYLLYDSTDDYGGDH